MKKTTFLFISTLLISILSSAQNSDIRKTVDTLLIRLDKLQNTDIKPELKQNFKKYLFTLRNLEADERNLKGAIKFGLNGIEVENSDQFVVNTGFNMSRGNFPFEFDLSADIQAQTTNGTFKETVSKVSIGFDYHFSDKSPLNIESYVFVNRSNNALLGIDQRYEVGGGLIFNSYSGRTSNISSGGDNKEQLKKKLTPKGVKKFGEISGLDDDYKIISKEDFVDCVDNICRLKKLISEKEGNGLKNSRKRFESSTRKKYSKQRISLLLGINYELEKTADQLSLFFRDSSITKSFETTNKYRFIVRPGYERKGDNFTFSVKPYFKLGLFSDIDNGVVLNDLQDNRIDFWIDIISTFSFRFTEKISLEITHNYFYDHAPNRAFVNIAENGEAEDFELFEAEKKFTALTFGFKYNL